MRGTASVCWREGFSAGLLATQQTLARARAATHRPLARPLPMSYVPAEGKTARRKTSSAQPSTLNPQGTS
eukprot:scaffold124572_cov27-Tisochrysis_lutea.AAC.9